MLARASVWFPVLFAPALCYTGLALDLNRAQASQAKTSEFCNLPVASGVWPETAICLSHRSSSATWAMGALSDFAGNGILSWMRLGRVGR